MTIPPEHLARIYALLVEAYGEPRWEPDYDPLGGLVSTILSQHTSDKNSGRAYQQLISIYPTWEEVRDAPTEKVAEAIKSGGLANIKAPRIQATLYTLTSRQQEQEGNLSLAEFFLHELNTCTPEEAWHYLQEIPGVGPKTAACVLMFNLGLAFVPVDTHVHRVTRRLGLIGPNVDANKAHKPISAMTPAAWTHTLHVDLIRHGRAVCHAQKPDCDRCPLYPECAYVGSIKNAEMLS
jgi:Predicted EndoIII-related endonuclease